jgi:hypothetical protein
MGKLEDVTTLHYLYCCKVPTETIRKPVFNHALWLAVVFHRILGSGSDGVMRCTEKYVLDF